MGAALIGYALVWIAVAVTVFPGVRDLYISDISFNLITGYRVLHGEVPYRQFDFEYPPFALFPITVPALAGLTGVWTIQRYAWGLLISNALWSSALALCAWRMARRRLAPRGALAASGMYALLTLVTVVLSPWRFDLFPTLLTALAVLLVLEGRPAAAGASLGLAIATKLYPIALVPVIAARYFASGERRAAITFGVAMVVTGLVAAVPFYIAAPADFFSFVRYHQERGLQVESVPAGLLMLGHLMGVTTLGVTTNYGAQHLVWRSADLLQRFLLPVFVLALSTVTVLAFRRFRSERVVSGQTEDATLVGYALISLLVFILSNKVLSPQFMIWLFPFVALLPRRQYALAALAIGLTILIFPYNYTSLVALEQTAVLMLNLRNLMLAGLAAWLLWSLRPTRAVA